MSVRPWSEVELIQAKRMWIAGMCARTIGKKLGRSETSIEHKLRILGFKKSERTGLVRHEWTPAQVSELKRRWPDTSLSIPEIAQRMGLTKHSVEAKARNLGLPARFTGKSLGQRKLAEDRDATAVDEAKDEALVALLEAHGGFIAYTESWMGRGIVPSSISRSKDWRLGLPAMRRAA